MLLDIIDSYEKRILIVNDIIERSREMMDSYQKLRESLAMELRDNLAHSKYLRKKDFDILMGHVHGIYDENEKEIREILHTYIHEHQNIAEQLKSFLGRSLENDNPAGRLRLPNRRAKLELIKQQHNESEQEVKRILQAYEYAQDSYCKAMDVLINEGRNVRLSEVKRVMDRLSQENLFNNKSNSLLMNKEVRYVS